MSAGDTMQGRRRDVPLYQMDPGDYGFAVYGPKDTGIWCCRAPNGGEGRHTFPQ